MDNEDNNSLVGILSLIALIMVIFVKAYISAQTLRIVGDDWVLKSDLVDIETRIKERL